MDRADESYLKHARYRGAVGPRFDWPPNDEHIRNIGNGKSGDMYRVPMTAVRTTPR